MKRLSALFILSGTLGAGVVAQQCVMIYRHQPGHVSQAMAKRFTEWNRRHHVRPQRRPEQWLVPCSPVETEGLYTEALLELAPDRIAVEWEPAVPALIGDTDRAKNKETAAGEDKKGGNWPWGWGDGALGGSTGLGFAGGGVGVGSAPIGGSGNSPVAPVEVPVATPTAVPEPGTLALVLSGLTMCGFVSKGRTR